VFAGDRLPTLIAGELRLRWTTTHDVDDLFAVFADAEVARFWSTPPMTRRDQAEALLRSVEEGFAGRTLLQWAIAGPDDRLIGTCTLAHVDRTHRRAELGFALGRPHWGQGHARAAVSAVLDVGFGELDLHRVEADVDPRNARSRALLERLGFVHEGLLRERWHVNGEICDAAFYGLLAPAWRARCATAPNQR
jgi:ribosomal-protein-alanine N-acetyltransferase